MEHRCISEMRRGGTLIEDIASIDAAEELGEIEAELRQRRVTIKQELDQVLLSAEMNRRRRGPIG